MNKYVFYDEGNSKDNKLKMLAASSVPFLIFDSLDIYQIIPIHDFVKKSYSEIIDGSYKDFNKDDSEVNKYLEWSTQILNRIGHTIKTNIMLYDNLVVDKNSEVNKYLIYNKLPERLIYGLLKHDNNIYETKTEIFLDSHNLYKEYNTAEYLKYHLNALSKYRTHHYHIESVNLIYKKEFSIDSNNRKEIINNLDFEISNLKIRLEEFKKEIEDIEILCNINEKQKENLKRYKNEINNKRNKLSLYYSSTENSDNQNIAIYKARIATLELEITSILNSKEYTDFQKYDDTYNEILNKKEKIREIKNEIILHNMKLGKYVVGISLVDLILNVVRGILIYNNEVQIGKLLTEKLIRRSDFIIHLISKLSTLSVFKQVKIFEWVGNDNLRQIDFLEHLNTFIYLMEVSDHGRV